MTRKFPARWGQFLFSLILSGMMSFIVSGVATLRAVGLDPLVLFKWLTAWPLAWVTAFPALFLLAPFVRKLVARLVEPPPERA